MSKFKPGDKVIVTKPDKGYEDTMGQKLIIKNRAFKLKDGRERYEVIDEDGEGDNLAYFAHELTLDTSNTHSIDVEKVIFNNRTVIVYANNAKGVATCSTDDSFDPVVGFAMAYTSAMLTNGNKSALKRLITSIYEEKEV